MENLKKTIHLRTAHSELVGFWSVEFGGRMNKVFHIWKYGKESSSFSVQYRFSFSIFKKNKTISLRVFFFSLKTQT